MQQDNAELTTEMLLVHPALTDSMCSLVLFGQAGQALSAKVREGLHHRWLLTPRVRIGLRVLSPAGTPALKLRCQ